MNSLLCLFIVAAAYSAVNAKESPPKVQVYSYQPGEYGKENTLICHVSGFHPPDITIELLKDEVVIPNTKLTDLAFEQDWHFHLTKSVSFTPSDGQKYTCRVTHRNMRKDYAWGEKNTSL
uniref:Beta-2-microglobulin n=1 Tax=Echeneis naucrates TaxID=173247 RepID=A0A665W9P2_ECHNA